MAKSTWAQERRLLEIESSLGKDKLLLMSLDGREAMSELFSYDIEMLSADGLHLNDLGYHCMAEYVAQAVVSALFLRRAPVPPP